MAGSYLIQGASRGIGLGLVERALAAEDNRNVIATCRQPDTAVALHALAEAHPGRLEILPLDVEQEASIAEVAKRLTDRGLALDLLLNTSGLLHDDRLRPEKRLADLDPANLHRAFAVNTIGPLLVAKHFVPLLKQDHRTLFASLSARVGSIGDNRAGGWYAYRASKAALNMGLKTLALELRRVAPQVICVGLHPGTVDTDLSRPFGGARKDRSGRFSVDLAARQLFEVLADVTPEQTGTVLAWDGSTIPW